MQFAMKCSLSPRPPEPDSRRGRPRRTDPDEHQSRHDCERIFHARHVRFRFAGDGGVRTLSLSDSISPTGRFRFLSRSAKASSASSWKLLPTVADRGLNRLPGLVVELNALAGACVLPGYHLPVFGIDAQGSCFCFGLPFCRSSIEMLSGERMKAMWPSRGGRLMTTPFFIRRSQVS